MAQSEHVMRSMEQGGNWIGSKRGPISLNGLSGYATTDELDHGSMSSTIPNPISLIVDDVLFSDRLFEIRFP
jgi:hypothetical protein